MDLRRIPIIVIHFLWCFAISVNGTHEDDRNANRDITGRTIRGTGDQLNTFPTNVISNFDVSRLGAFNPNTFGSLFSNAIPNTDEIGKQIRTFFSGMNFESLARFLFGRSDLDRKSLVGYTLKSDRSGGPDDFTRQLFLLSTFAFFFPRAFQDGTIFNQVPGGGGGKNPLERFFGSSRAKDDKSDSALPFTSGDLPFTGAFNALVRNEGVTGNSFSDFFRNFQRDNNADNNIPENAGGERGPAAVVLGSQVDEDKETANGRKIPTAGVQDISRSQPADRNKKSRIAVGNTNDQKAIRAAPAARKHT